MSPPTSPVALLGLLSLLSVSACSDDETTSSTSSSSSSGTGGSGAGAAGGGGSGGTASCGPVPGQPADEECIACTWTNCCAEDQACAADPVCNELASCLQTCGGDGACFEQQCVPIVMMNGPRPQLLDLFICQLESCDEACNNAPLCDALSSSDGYPECSACTEATCCDEAQAANTVEQISYQKCLIECADAACLYGCEQRFAAGVAQATALNTCVYGECGDACSGTTSCGFIGFIPPTCNDCGVASCCEPWEICSQDASCMDFFQCYISCTTVESCTQCAELWPYEVVGKGLVGHNCLGSACTDECTGGMPFCGLADRIDTLECRDCITTGCCDEGTACGLDASCAGLKVCVTLCDGDAACETDCEAELPAGVPLYQALQGCTDAACTGVCP